MNPTMLPARTAEAEDEFVASLETAPPETLIPLVTDCVAASRPMLAARIVSLIPETPTGDNSAPSDPAIDRARRASRLLLVAPVDRRGPVIAEFESAVAELKSRFVTRARARHRKNARDVMDTRKPRRKPRGTR
jgi:hypothetical protein